MTAQNSGNWPLTLGPTSSTVKFLQSVLNPYKYSVAPPNIFNQPTFTKNVTLTGNWVVGDPATEGAVKSSSGIAVWETQRGGVGTFTRYGILPAGVHQVSPGGVPGIWVPNINALSVNSFGDTINFTSASEIPLPYVRDQNGANFVLAPDLGQDFSTCRAYAAMMSVVSDSVPIGNTALTGKLSCGSFADIRDILDVNGVTFSPSSMVQQSFTKKDGMKDVDIADGIVSLLGADLQPNFNAPVPATTTTYGISDTETLPVTTVFNTGLVASQTSEALYVSPTPYGMLFVTPWNITSFSVQRTTATAWSALTAGVIRCSTIPLQSNIEIEVILPPSSEVQLTAEHDGLITLSIQHVFVGVSSTGNVVYYYSRPVMSQQQIGVAGNRSFSGLTCKASINSQYPEHKDDRMWLGCIIGGEYQNTNTSNATSPPTFISDDIYISVKAESIYNGGQLGPSRAIRWDNVSPGQEVKCNGQVLCQVQPEGQLAPYVAQRTEFQELVLHMNLLPFVSALFNGPGLIRRNWRRSDYNYFIDRFVSSMSVSGLSALDEASQEAARNGGLAPALMGAGQLNDVHQTMPGKRLRDDMM